MMARGCRLPIKKGQSSVGLCDTTEKDACIWVSLYKFVCIALRLLIDIINNVKAFMKNSLVKQQQDT